MRLLKGMTCALLCLYTLAVVQPAEADQFPGQGDEQTWLKACDICNQGVVLTQKRQYPAAFQYFQKAIDMYPYDPVYYFNLGVAHQQYAYFAAPAAKQQELSQALTSFQQAARLKPDKPDVWLHLANVQNSLAQYQDSLNSLETAMSLPTLSASDRQSAALAAQQLRARGAVSKSNTAAPNTVPTVQRFPAPGADNSTTTTAISAAAPRIETTTPAALVSASAPGQTAPDWRSYKSSAFTMQYPNGWTVTTDQANGRIETTDGSGARLQVQPFFTANKVDSPDQFFKTMLKTLAPDAKWTKPERHSDNAWRSTFKDSKQSGVAGLLIYTTEQGTQGKVCVATIPKGAQVGSGTIAGMIDSIRFTGQASQPQAAEPHSDKRKHGHKDEATGISAATGNGVMPGSTLALPPTRFMGYTIFRDPNEHSYTIQVPAGWEVTGGLYRPRAIDARPWVKTTSPDKLISAFYGDPSIPPYTMPTATGTSLGFGVGTKYNGGLIEPYMPARRFVERYAKESLKRYIRDFKIVEEANHPDIARAVNGTVGATRSECASIKFTGTYNNIPAVGYYIAATKATVAYGSGMWWVNLIAGEVSAADRSNGGLSVLLTMLRSFQFDPAWKGQSVKTAGDVSREYTAASHALSDSIVNRYWSQQAFNDSMNAAYWNRQAVQDHAADNFSNYIRGVENVRDPDTGTQYQVQYGPQYHYINPQGVIGGSNYGAPGPEWRQLMSVP